jgi:hypothetical protein
MNKLRKIVLAVCSLVLVSVGTSVKADSGNFAGPYFGVTASGYGISADSTSNSRQVGDNSSTSSDNLQIGKVAAVYGIELGYVLPLGSAFLIDVGGTYHSGEAKFHHNNDDGDTGGDVSFTVDDLVTYYIAPTVVLSDTSSLYVKVGLSEADTGVTGDVTTPARLSGQTWAIGTRTVLNSGIFIRTEAGYTDYNEISARGKGTTVQSTTTYSANPTIAFGTVSLGFRF